MVTPVFCIRLRVGGPIEGQIHLPFCGKWIFIRVDSWLIRFLGLFRMFRGASVELGFRCCQKRGGSANVWVAQKMMTSHKSARNE